MNIHLEIEALDHGELIIRHAVEAYVGYTIAAHLTHLRDDAHVVTDTGGAHADLVAQMIRQMTETLHTPVEVVVLLPFDFCTA